MITGIVGDINFKAPEVLAGLPYNYKADSWAVGVILYYILTMKYPFSASTNFSLEEDIARGTPNIEYLKQIGYSHNVSDLISKLL